MEIFASLLYGSLWQHIHNKEVSRRDGVELWLDRLWRQRDLLIGAVVLLQIPPCWRKRTAFSFIGRQRDFSVAGMVSSRTGL